MQVLIAFLVLTFLSGSRLARRGGNERVGLLLVSCVFVAGVLMLERFA